MAELNRAVASLRIVGEDLRPDDLTTSLGVRPSSSFTRGDDVRHGPMPPRVARFGLWTLDAPETEPADIDRQVSALLRPVTDDLDIWRELAVRFDVSLFCGWFMKHGNEGTAISPETLLAVAERRIMLELDIYSGDDE